MNNIFGSAITTFQYVGRAPTVLQIGANDGKKNDPILEFMQTFIEEATLVEPQSDAFAALQQNYEDKPNYHLIKSAIHPQKKILLCIK